MCDLGEMMAIPERLFLKKPEMWDARLETKREIPWRETLTEDEFAFVVRCYIIVSNAMPVSPPAQWVSVIGKLAKLLDEMQGTPITPRGR